FKTAAGQGSFVGPGPTGAAGPNGVTIVGPNEVAGGDGDSTLKIVNLDSGEVASVSTGGTHRVDEMAYDPANDLLVAANDREGDTANFITVFKVHPLSIVERSHVLNVLAGSNNRCWSTAASTLLFRPRRQILGAR